MNFLIDAQLPPRLKYRLQELGHDAIHTSDLPQRNRTSDSEIVRISVEEKRGVITKDADFVNSFIIHAKPYKLLLISTGNSTNFQLENIILQNFTAIVSGFSEYSFIEVGRDQITYHR